MTLGNLTHFNWPRLLRNKPTIQGLVQDLSYDGSYMHETGKHGECYIFVRIK